VRQIVPLHNSDLASVKRRLREGTLTRNIYRIAGALLSYARRIPDRIRHGRSYPPSFFDSVFTRSADPWSYEASTTSEQRRELLFDIVSARFPSRLLEIGCATGWMTATLAPRVQTMTAIDISSVALTRAKERCKNLSNVHFRRLDIAIEEIPDTFDLVLCAGVLVYLPWSVQHLVRERILQSVSVEGALVLEHRYDSVECCVAGRDIHDLYCSSPRMHLLSRHRRDIYEVVVLSRIS
jgi:SAM-dependent methyltransferase